MVQRFFLALALFFACAALAAEDALKTRSAFYAPETLAKVRSNLEKHPSGKSFTQQAVNTATFWRELPDDELWGMMFGPKISRSWMVWSNGHCPACKQSVPMYDWKMEPQKSPWKLQCPHCSETFPKNDFAAFHKSGLDERGFFDPERADRSLLFNTEHPDPADPLHRFGVDDGEGYVEGEKRWRFIGYYLIYGQFKKLVFDGIKSLAVAHVFTGDPVYARKAAILLDRVADVYPEFDYAKQGLVYERRGHNGYVSVWHDASEETRELAMAYDQIFEAIRNDEQLIAFLSGKASTHKLANRKTSFADIQRNIETRILRDAVTNGREKIKTNFPRMEAAEALIVGILGWPENRAQVEALIDTFVRKATSVDGVTGEKGLAGYGAGTIAGMAFCLAEFDRADPTFLPDLLKRVPTLRQTYRFHIDTACLDAFFYPVSGDTGSFGMPYKQYRGLSMLKLSGRTLLPSNYTFLWRLYEETGDAAYVQVLYRENGGKLDGLPHDLFVDDPEKIREGIREMIEKKGAELNVGSVNKEQWCMAILRSGTGDNARALWLDYDYTNVHAHADGMTLGLFAHGYDLLPDFGYPPVQFGGWDTQQTYWYKSTPAHNTVTVDGKDQARGGGKTTLWADGDQFRSIRASASNLIGGEQYERTACLVDVSVTEFYVLDIFRVKGGSDHAKFVHGPAGSLTTEGLVLKPAADYGHGTFTRKFQGHTNPAPSWSATWTVEDFLKLLPAGKTLRLQHIDLSNDVQANTAEAWSVPTYHTGEKKERWNPILMLRRQGVAPLASTFVSVLETYTNAPVVARARRLTLQRGETSAHDADVVLEIELADKRRDLFVSINAESDPLKKGESYTNADWALKSDAEVLWLRKNNAGEIERIVLCNGRSLTVGPLKLECREPVPFLEIALDKNHAIIVAGDRKQIQKATMNSVAIEWR